MPSIVNASATGEQLDSVRTEYQNLPVRQILNKPPHALLGVSLQAEAALKTLEVNTVFDLATSSVFDAATKLANAGTNLKSALYQHGSPTADLVREADAAGKKVGELQFLPIHILESIPEAAVATVQDALDVQTVRDLALYPPYRSAVHLLNAAYFPENVSGFDPEQPADLLPKTGEYPTERVQYTTLLMDAIPLAQGEAIQDITDANFKPLDLTVLAAGDAGFKKVAFGALLTFNQSWYAQGVTLGQLLHSTSLAPGESTRIAVVDWSRKSRAGETEVISEADELASDTSRNRSITEVTQAVADEAQGGFSEATTNSRSAHSGTATAAEMSAPLGGLFGGPSGSIATSSGEGSSSSRADSYSTSFGHRQIGSSMLQNVNDRTHQNAHSSRSRRASVIKEVSQSEHEGISTRVLANYNHMHALTIQYYEVVQVYRAEVAIVKADKVVFIPVQLVDFGNDAPVRRFRNALARAALTNEMREALRNLEVLEISPDHDTVFTLLGDLLRNILGAASVTRADFAAVSPPAIRFIDSIPLLQQVNGYLWTVDQAARLSGLLNLAVLRPDSTAIYLPTDVTVEGSVVTADGAPVKVVFHTQQGTNVAEVSAELPLAMSRIARIGITGSSAERDVSAVVTLTVNRNGVRFPLQLPAVTVAKGQAFETYIVQVKPGGVNANLKQHLNDNRMYYSQAIFRALDSTQIALLLAGYGVKVSGSVVPVAQVVEPRPIRYVGNYLAFKMNTDATSDGTWASWLEGHGIILGSTKDDIIPLPSGGTFAEAVLGRSNCAEKLDITRFWNWQDSPTPLQPTEIAAIKTGSRATNEDVKPGQLSNPIINITAPTNVPDPTGTAAVLAAIQNGNIFRDMSGLQSTIALAQAALQAASAGASAAGEQAGTNMNNLLKANTERQRIAAEMITSLARTAASAYTGGAIGAGGGISGGAGVQGISGDGARINHGRSMDSRGLPGPNSSGTGSGGGDSTPAGRFSHEAAYADRSAFGYSPDAVNAVIGVPDGSGIGATQVVFGRDDVDAAQKYAPLWADLLRFEVPITVVSGLAARNMKVQRYNDGIGDLNLDLYTVKVVKLPKINGVQVDQAGLLEHVRLHLNSFVDTSYSQFIPYQLGIDDTKWNSASPVGAVIKIDIPGPDNAAVVVSLAESTRWRFSTVQTLDTGTHPVCGHREFGFRKADDGSIIYFTRGADRTTEAPETMFDFIAFAGADKLWVSLQDKLANFVNANDGVAVKLDRFSRRFKWSVVRILLNLSDQPIITI